MVNMQEKYKDLILVLIKVNKYDVMILGAPDLKKSGGSQNKGCIGELLKNIGYRYFYNKFSPY